MVYYLPAEKKEEAKPTLQTKSWEEEQREKEERRRREQEAWEREQRELEMLQGKPSPEVNIRGQEKIQ